jgi:hypothetical protein
MNFLKLFVKDFFENRLPRPRLFSGFQTVIFIITVPIWFVLFKLIGIDNPEKDYPYQLYLFPFIYFFMILPFYFYAFIDNDKQRSALPFTGKIPFLNAVLHAFFFCLALFIFSNGGERF